MHLSQSGWLSRYVAIGISEVRSSSTDVKTAVTALGISERFIIGIKDLDCKSRSALFNFIDIIFHDDILLSDYQDFTRVLGAIAEKALIMKDNEEDKKTDNPKRLDFENGLVVLSHKETANYYAIKMGNRLTTIIMADARNFAENMGYSIDEI